MNYPVHVDGAELVATLDRLLQLLGNSQYILFDAMAKMTVGAKVPFIAPAPGADPAIFSKKRNEIAVILKSPAMLRGLAVALQLFEETYREVDSQGGILGRRPDDLLQILSLTTDRPGEIISLSKEGRWTVAWPVRAPRGGTTVKMSCDWFAREWGFVVPPNIVNYLSTAATAHYQERNDVAVALLSIAAEATLRDVLSSKGYSFLQGASKVDIYEYSTAHVTADTVANAYIVKFDKAMALAPSSFPSSGIDIKIRRVPKGNPTTRFDLNMRAQSPIQDYWSSILVETAAVRSVGGLGAALDIARNHEKCLSPEDLAADFDEVLQAVRNNLVHLSGSALDTLLPPYDFLKREGNFTLRDFLESERLVQDFIFAISRFVNDQYVNLRGSGTFYT